ncbi:shikimate kinase [Gracilibacillus halophilus YIM-C55.5]|uniref:Shikimate kinase n=1 Tax=Gracilibacillus halophilus YIM-C55.5 TaxID=1308866 RepID=N4WSW9_9BACI|nr:shikimate kinase [Gracilibacillus halophilus]ENH97455.1 shikimate kinase [Gracilibacillus halophilus YIM-C55.5]
MHSIYLVGFMGSGKTSIAKGLQQWLRMETYDTDALIEANYGQSIPKIFAEDGEETFRQYETNTLKQTVQEDAIVATGGGIVEREENRSWLKEHGIVIFLETSWDEINRRLIHDTSRPIWNNQNRDKHALLHRRTPLYEEVADKTVITDDKSVEQICDEIIAFVHKIEKD